MGGGKGDSQGPAGAPEWMGLSWRWGLPERREFRKKALLGVSRRGLRGTGRGRKLQAQPEAGGRGKANLCHSLSLSRIGLCDPVAHSPPGSSVHGDSPGKNTGVVVIPSSRDLPDPGTEPGFPTLQADSLLSEPPRRPEGIFRTPCGVGGRSIFETVGMLP